MDEVSRGDALRRPWRFGLTVPTKISKVSASAPHSQLINRRQGAGAFILLPLPLTPFSQRFGPVRCILLPYGFAGFRQKSVENQIRQTAESRSQKRFTVNLA